MLSEVHKTYANSVWVTRTTLGSFRKSGLRESRGFEHWHRKNPEGEKIGEIPEELLW